MSVAPRKRQPATKMRPVVKGHVWTAPSWQGEASRRRLGRCSHVFGLSAVHMTAGHNALRGSGPGHKPAFENAMALVGCPDRRIDRLCITCCSPSQPSHHAMVLGAISSDPQRGWIIVSLAPGHHCPSHSGELVGKGDGSDFRRPSCQQCCDPGPILGAMELGIADDGECARHEQAARIAVPLFADTAEPGAPPARVLFRYQPDPGREVAT